ncbi:MAG: potassium transporter, partial [Pseudomonadales bacterium]
MHIQIAFRVLGVLLMIFSLTMLPPVFVSWIYDDGVGIIFINTFLFTLLTGFILWLFFRWDETDMRIKDGFL